MIVRIPELYNINETLTIMILLMNIIYILNNTATIILLSDLTRSGLQSGAVEWLNTLFEMLLHRLLQSTEHWIHGVRIRSGK